LPILPQILIPFLLGLFGGSIVGLFSDVPHTLFSSFDFIFTQTGNGTFLYTFWHAFRFVFVCAMLALWIPGFLLIPLLSALRAFVFACSIAVLIRPYSTDAFLLAFISFGIPALIELPGFFLASTEAFRFSRQLSRRRQASAQRFPNQNHLILIVLFCLADAAYMHFLLPLLNGFLS
jgi:hypothetical protein